LNATRKRPWNGASSTILLTLAVATGMSLSACRGAEHLPSDAHPPGTHVLVDRERAAPFIKAVSEGRARVSRIAARVAASPPCPLLYGSTLHGGLAEAIEGLSCDGVPPASMVELRKSANADVTVLFSGPAPRTIALGHVDDEGTLTLDVTPTAGGFPEWLTSDAPPSRAVLDETDALIAARWRAPSVKVDASSDEFAGLGALRATLASALLDGGWEFFVYRSADASSILPVIALSTRSESAARTALEEVATSLSKTYRLGRASVAVGDDTALCLSPITALPDLAPCALVRDSFVIMGWNANAILRGLALAVDEPPRTSFLRVDFSRIDELDRELHEAARARRAPLAFEPSSIREVSLESVKTPKGSIVRVRLSTDVGAPP
jgi:hypothetical protein